MAAPAQSDQLETKLRSMILQNTTPAPDQGSQQSVSRRGHHQHHSRGSQNFRAQTGHHQPSPGFGRGHNAQQPSRAFASSRGQGHYSQRAHHAPQLSRDNVNWRAQGNGHSPQVLQRPPAQAAQQHHHQPAHKGRAQSKFVPLNRSFGRSDDIPLQCQFLEDVARIHLPNLEMPEDEFIAKDKFRLSLQALLQQAVSEAYPQDRTEVTLQPFGSISSGFAMPGSDMDLALHSTMEHPDIFRMFQKVLLDLGIGARVLSRTRVPILKICELPPAELLAALRQDREQWDKMTPEEREAHDDGRAIEKERPVKDTLPAHTSDINTDIVPGHSTSATDSPAETALDGDNAVSANPSSSPPDTKKDASNPGKTRPPRKDKPWYREKRLGPLDFPKSGVGIQCDINYENPLGIHNSILLRCYSHCDVRVRLLVLFVKGWASKRKINSSYNGTLSSYGFVLMVLHYLVNIAHPPVCPNLQNYRLSGDALSRPRPNNKDPNQVCSGYDVRFWRAEQEILSLAGRQMLTHNREPLGALLRGFFQYYAQQGQVVPRGGFAWTQQVLSLRTPGGIITKAAKGWTGATTTVLNTDGTTTVIPNAANSSKTADHSASSAPARAHIAATPPPTFSHGSLKSAPSPLTPGQAATQTPQADTSKAPHPSSAAQDPLPPGAREVRNRYLFAIEDPFEVTHNVARTVTHPGIVAIRDEFRRAWRILQAVGRGQEPVDGDLMEAVVSIMPPKEEEDASAAATVAVAGADKAGEDKDGETVATHSTT